MKRVVIVGHGMAGTRLVRELTALDRTLAITVFGAEPHPPYNRVLLTNVLAGKAGEDDIRLSDEADVDVRTGVAVTSIDRSARTVTTSTGDVVGYDVLVLATGSQPFHPPIKGLVHDDGRLTRGSTAFRTLDDCRRIQRLAGRSAGRVLVLGGGPLGLEAACGLASRGVPVEVLHSGGRLMDRVLDAEASRMLLGTLCDADVPVRLGAAVTEVTGKGRLTGVLLADGTHVPGNLLIVACGTRAHTALAAAAGLPVGRGILVDDQMRTEDPAVFAVGDCAEHAGAVHGLVAPAWEQVRVAAHVIAGTKRLRYHGSRAITRLKAVGVDLAAMGETQPDDDDDIETVRFVDSARRTYHKLVLRDDRLAGAIMLGEIGTVGTVTQLFDRQDAAPADRRGLLFPDLGSGSEPDPDSLPDSATVCQCNAVTKQAIVGCVAAGETTVAGVAERTRATTGCGGCRDMVRGLVETVTR